MPQAAEANSTIPSPASPAVTAAAYAVLVSGNSMGREFRHGDTALIHPHKLPKPSDPCVFHGVRSDGTVDTTLKYLERSPDASNEVYFVSQASPRKSFTISKADWQTCHVAVGKISAL